MTAMLVPIAETAGKGLWWGNAILLCVSIAFTSIETGKRSVRWHGYLKSFAMGILLAEMLHAAAKPWTGEKAEYAVPLVILALAEYAAEKGEEKAARSANVLRYGIIAVIAVVLFSGASEIKEIKLQKILQNQNGWMPIMLLPMIVRKGKQNGRRWMGIAVFTIVSGIIARAITEQGEFYELSRSISTVGMSLRFESIAAMAITLGYYVLSTYLLCASGREIDEVGDSYKNGLRMGAIAAAAWYLINIRIHAVVMITVILILWGVLPWIEELKIKMKKGVDK